MREELQAPDSGKSQLREVKRAVERSPQNHSHTLQNIIKSGRAVVVAPLITGGYQSATLIATGQYLAALKCAGAAGLAFLLLTVFLVLADAFVEFIKKWQTVKINDGDS